MPRATETFACSACGAGSAKWQGQCATCSAWNTLERVRVPAGSGRRSAGPVTGTIASRAVALATLAGEHATAPRLASGSAEMDRVLGGGLVPGSAILLGGDPGIGKSTLLLQLAARIAATHPVLYASGEESAEQVALRARRLGADVAGLSFVPETSLGAILDAAAATRARVLVVDSVQTVQVEDVASSAGSVAQLRECTAALVRYAKSTGTAVIIVGHVTKEGTIAGPRVLEHLVDCVLYFESDAGSRFRIVRSVKNRFGSVGDLAFFAMTEGGLREVANPSAIFLARPERIAPGSVVTVTRDGARALLVEIQALVDASRFGNPRRVAEGLDANRLSMLLAVLNRHAGLALQDQDVFANVVGGLALRETAADLPLLLAVVSSLRGRPAPAPLVAFGEVGLTGEIRPVAYGEERLREAARQGFSVAIVPRGNAPRGAASRGLEVIEVIAVEALADAVDALNQRS